MSIYAAAESSEDSQLQVHPYTTGQLNQDCKTKTKSEREIKQETSILIRKTRPRYRITDSLMNLVCMCYSDGIKP